MNETNIIEINGREQNTVSPENLDFILNLHLPRWNELPGIDLYMDQLIGYIDSAIGDLFRKIDTPPLTKSMVNNYVKAKIIQAPTNKKYSKLAVASAMVVCILKSSYSVDEIGTLIRMGIGLNAIPTTYDRFCEAIESALREAFLGEIALKETFEAGRENKYLMVNFALSFACKYYAQLNFLHPQKNDKDQLENKKHK